MPRAQLQIFVRGDAADGRFVHLDRVGDRAQGQRLEMRDAVAEERLLLLHDLARDLEDRPLALVERLDQPVGAGEHSPSQAFAFLSCGPVDSST